MRGGLLHLENNFSYDVNYFFSVRIENIFYELLLRNTKPVVVGHIYQPPRQSKFLETINTHFSKLNANKDNKNYIPSNFIISLCPNACMFRNMIGLDWSGLECFLSC